MIERLICKRLLNVGIGWKIGGEYMLLIGNGRLITRDAQNHF